MTPEIRYGTFWRMKPTEYDPNPRWRLFCGWYQERKCAEAECKRVKILPQCGEAKVVKSVTTFEDVAEE